MSHERTMRNECYSCPHKRDVPGNAHVACAKPDPKMTGHEHGRANGWFIYPALFDPVWKTRPCANYDGALGMAAPTGSVAGGNNDG